MDTSFDMFIETEVPDYELIISRTDLKGNISYANETFAMISGYESDELIGKPHNIVRHPDMPKSVSKELWGTLSRGENWQGFVFTPDIDPDKLYDKIQSILRQKHSFSIDFYPNLSRQGLNEYYNNPSYYL